MGKTFRRKESKLPKWFDDVEGVHRDGTLSNRTSPEVKSHQNTLRRRENRGIKQSLQRGEHDALFCDDFGSRKGSNCGYTYS